MKANQDVSLSSSTARGKRRKGRRHAVSSSRSTFISCSSLLSGQIISLFLHPQESFLHSLTHCLLFSVFTHTHTPNGKEKRRSTTQPNHPLTFSTGLGFALLACYTVHTHISIRAALLLRLGLASYNIQYCTYHDGFRLRRQAGRRRGPPPPEHRLHLLPRVPVDLQEGA
jgi:hypothetical protein